MVHSFESSIPTKTSLGKPPGKMTKSDNETVEDIILQKYRGLYSFHTTEESGFKLKKQQVHDFGTLSLFKDVENDSTSAGNSPHNTDRPVTPINDSIKSAPKTYAGLSKLIHRRIHPRTDWEHISVEDQSSLGAVIMGEVNTVWPLLRNQLADPFLTHHQNRELHRRIAVHCVTVCEHLFQHYADKIKTLNDKGIFTNSANMSRIRGQLAVDAGKYLNILSVRRHIVADLKKPLMKEQITYSREEATRSPSTPGPAQIPKQLSFRKLIKSSRPTQKLRYQFNLNAEIQNMQSVMPTISLSKVEALMEKSHSFLQNRYKYEELEKEGIDYSASEQNVWKTGAHEMDIPALQGSQRHRCPSEPMIPHTLLLDEILQIEKEEDDYLLMRSPSMIQESCPDSSLKTPIPPNEGQPIRCHTAHGRLRDRYHDAGVQKKDTEHLIDDETLSKEQPEAQRGDEVDDSDELPPLIQAITRRQIQDAKLKKLREKEKELDKKREEELKELMKPLPQPQYFQPPIVQSKLPGVSNPITKTPITIRASDVKINDRVDLSSVTLQLYQPIYNDLSGDISQATVKELDANLFQGGELKEVYTEIMKTVPNIHQQHDNDSLIVSPASNVDLSKILASSTLVRPRSQQVINSKLCRDDLDIPWEGQQLNTRRPSYQPYAGYPDSETTSASQLRGEEFAAFHRFTPSQLHHPGVDKESRAYASWLQWWKSTVNSDDFFKYLSTQDTDFLSVIFHFYDSEYDDSDFESMRTDKLEAQRERERKIAELKKEKEEYTPGLWNVKTITLGGLGKDPILEEESETSYIETPLSTSRSHRHSQSTPRSLRTMSQTPRDSSDRACRKSSLATTSNVLSPKSIKQNKVAIFPNTRDSDCKSLSESSALSKVSLIPAGVKGSVTTASDYESDVSKREDRKWFLQASSTYMKYLPNYFHQSDHPYFDLTQSRDRDSILRIVQSKNLQKAIMAGYSPSTGKYSSNSDAGERSETTTSGYYSANSEVATQVTSSNKNDILRRRIFHEKPPVYSKEKLKTRWRKIRERSAFSSDSPVCTKQFISSSDHYSRMERIIAENRIIKRYGSSPRGTKLSSKTDGDNYSKISNNEPEQTIQERLEIIWQKLKMPDSQKLDCALKYSSDHYVKFLPEITISWERVTEEILRREKIITDLEIFEKEASDPNRFFEKGEKGSSATRLSEAKTRASLYKKLEFVESIIRELLSSIKRQFSDVVTFNGRPYDEKMNWDRIEMLYFLQQERRCFMLTEHGHPESHNAFINHGQMRPQSILPPIRKGLTRIPVNSISLIVPEL